MSLITAYKEIDDALTGKDADAVRQFWAKYEQSFYKPDEDTKAMLGVLRRCFVLGDVTMNKPRVEFNDVSVLNRMIIDQMAFNTYQPNNGQASVEDALGGWRSNAIRPVVRNKCISIAAHATARLIFPKVFAEDENSEDQQDAATVMEDLMEWSAEQSNYAKHALFRTISALTDPASIGFTEYAEVYHKVKRPTTMGKWEWQTELDEELSGFQSQVVPVNELYIENFFEEDIQKQGWLIWRRVISYSLAKALYGEQFPNFNKYVRAGVQLIYNDANQSFYSVYDANMRQEDVEVVRYWNKGLDVDIIECNGVMLTDYDRPNNRLDKKYPFDKFGYELINTRCFYYKSLAFKLQQDANIVNTLYPLIIDGTYLSVMPPMINSGGEIIGSDVIVPGVVTTFSNPDAKLTPVNTSINLRSGHDTLAVVENSLNDTSENPITQGQDQSGQQTAYEISRLEQNAATVLGLFVKMISDHVKQFGELRKSDIIQYLTIVDVNKLESSGELVYKAFMRRDKNTNGGSRNRKIVFDASLPSKPMTESEKLDQSFKVLKEQGGVNSKTSLYKVNPELFRNLKYSIVISPDVLNPRSEDLERAFNLEAYDRLIANPLANQEETLRLMLTTNHITKKDPDKYIAQQQPAQQDPMALMNKPPQGQPAAGNSPLNALNKGTPQPTVPSPR